jgi:hypothetical protein
MICVSLSFRYWFQGLKKMSAVLSPDPSLAVVLVRLRVLLVIRFVLGGIAHAAVALGHAAVPAREQLARGRDALLDDRGSLFVGCFGGGGMAGERSVGVWRGARV